MEKFQNVLDTITEAFAMLVEFINGIIDLVNSVEADITKA